MNYDFNAARSLYDQAAHPRLMLGADDIVTLRRLVASGDGAKLMADFRRKVRRLVRAVLDAPDLVEMLLWKERQWNQPGILVRMCLDEIALLGVIDEDADALEALRRVFACAADPRLTSAVDLSAIAFDIGYHHLTDKIRKDYAAWAIRSMDQQLAQVRGHILKVPAGNIPLSIALAGLPAVLALAGEPGVENLEGRRQEMLLYFEAIVNATIHREGYPEEDIGYGTGVSAFLIRTGEMLRRAGIFDPYVACPHYARFGRAILHFVQPWGENLTNTGDHGSDFQDRAFALARLAKETNDPSLLWLLGTLYYTHGMVHPQNLLPEHYIETTLRPGFRAPANDGSLLTLPDLKGEKHPSKLDIPTSFCEPARGLVSFRSSWAPDATYVVFDGSQRSPAGPGHAHDSCGHFSISALGDYFAIDNGRYNNEQACHNVMLVDGKSGRPLNGQWMSNYCFGRLTAYEPGQFVDFASVDSSHQHNCMWAWRYLGLVKGANTPAYVWTVDDVNKANDWADFWWTLNTSPENKIEIQGQTASIKGWRSGNHLDVHFALPLPQHFPKPFTLELAQDINRASAWNYYSDFEHMARQYPKLTDQVHGALYLRPRLIAKIGGYNGRAMSIMLPRLAGADPARVERLDSIVNTLAVRITFPQQGVADTLIWAYQHQLLKAGDVDERGDWCVVRRSLKTGKVLEKAVGGGEASRRK